MARVHRVEARLSWDEKADLTSLALRRNLTLSGLTRALILRALEQELAREDVLRQAYPQKYRTGSAAKA